MCQGYPFNLKFASLTDIVIDTKYSAGKNHALHCRKHRSWVWSHWFSYMQFLKP